MAGKQMPGMERITADEPRQGWNRKPARRGGSRAIESGKLLIGQIRQSSSMLSSEPITNRFHDYRLEHGFENWNGSRQPLTQKRESFPLGLNTGIEKDIGQQAAQQVSAGLIEVIAVPPIAGIRKLAAEPGHD